jgi:integrase
MQNISRQTGKLRVDEAFYTASVFVRHSPKCEFATQRDASGQIVKEADSTATKCDCPKSLMVYNGTTKKQEKVSAHTRSWAQAAIKAEEWLDQFDPTKIEQARKEAASVTVEKAVYQFLSSKKNVETKTLDSLYCLFGKITEDGSITREGKLFPWLAKQSPRINYISELTSTHLENWRNAWTVADSTAYDAWGKVVDFFNYCTKHKMITENPVAVIDRPPVKKGNRTAIFSDTQLDTVLEKASKGSELFYAFVLLLRWSAMALVDATLFNVDSIDQEGVLNYKRKKTGVLATVRLPKDVVNLLRKVSTDNKQPFLRTDVMLSSSEADWRKQLQALFTDAGIQKIKTEISLRNAHPHMFRDTCIVWFLRKGMSLHTAAKILGHSNTIMIQTHYLPFVEELRRTVIDETAGILQAHGAD